MGKNLLVVVLVGLCAGGLHAQEAVQSGSGLSSPPDNYAPTPNIEALPSGNILRNGNFAHGKQDWDTRGKIVEVNGWNVLEIDAARREPQSLSTAFKIDRNSRVLAISFEVQAKAGFVAGPSSMGTLCAKITIPSGEYVMQDFTLEPGHDLQTFRWKYEVPTGLREASLCIEVRPAKGSLYFSHIVIEPLKN